MLTRKKLYTICLLGTLFYFYETLIEVSPSTMLTGIMASFHINAATLGWLDSAYFLSYAAMQIPSGILLDYMSPRFLFPLAALCCCLGLALFALFPHTLGLALVGRFIAGIGGSFGLLGAMYLLSHYWPYQRYLAFAMGLAIMIGLSGGLMQAPMLWVVTHTSWRHLIVALAILAALFSTIMLRTLPKENAVIDVKKRFHIKHLAILKRPSMWCIAIYGGLMYLPTGILGSLWGIRYLQAYYSHYNATTLANVNALIFLGWIVGSPLWGWISDRLQTRKPILFFCAMLVTCCLFILAYSSSLSIFIISLVMFMLGVASGGSGLTFVMAKERNTRNVTGTAIGFVNMLAILPSVLLIPLFGWLLDTQWQGSIHGGARFYTLGNFQTALWFMVGIIGISVVLPFFMRSSKPVEK